MEIIVITPERKAAAEKIRLAAYCRVSSDSADQLHSFAAQIRYYKEYEKTHPKYRLVDVYADEGITGTSAEKRDELNRLIRDCKKGLIDRVIVKSVSRLARNTQDLLLIIRTLKDVNVSIYFEEQGIDTDKLNSEMIVTFPGMAAQQESESISGNMRWSYKKRMESGDFNTCYPAYGFRLVNGQLAIHEEEAEIIRRIFDMYLQGYGKYTIASILTEEKIPRRNGYNRWYGFNIDYILSNERYMGDAVLQKSYTPEVIPYRKIKNNGAVPQYYVESANTAIISKEIFDAAKALKGTRRTAKTRRYSNTPLSHKLYCPDCGRTFRRKMSSGRAYWMCAGRSSGENDCKIRRVSEDAVYHTFSMMIYKLKDNNEALFGELIHDIEMIGQRINNSSDRLAHIDKEIDDLSARNLVIVRLHTNGVLSGADYSAQSTEINNKLTALRSERKKITSENKSSLLLEQIRELHAIINECDPTVGFDADLFGDIVEKVVVQNNAELTFTLIGGINLTEIIDKSMRCKSV